MRAKKLRCVRCESLERSQKSKSIHYVKNALGESIPLCSTCILEMKEEEDFIRLAQEEDENESGSEILD
jgi:hypothetical protein